METWQILGVAQDIAYQRFMCLQVKIIPETLKRKKLGSFDNFYIRILVLGLFHLVDILFVKLYKPFEICKVPVVFLLFLCYYYYVILL